MEEKARDGKEREEILPLKKKKKRNKKKKKTEERM